MQRAAEHRGDNGNLVWRDHYEYDQYGNRWQNGKENTGRPYVEVYQEDYDLSTNHFVSSWGEYDAAGNLTEDQLFGYQSHVYDAKGRSVSTTSLATQQVVSSAVYDGLGQRVQTTEGGVTRRQIYAASGMLLTEYENGVLKRDCIYANGELVATEEPTIGKRYHLNDQQGSARVVTDYSGLITARHDYLPFGEEIGLLGQRQSSQGYGGADGNRKRYAGMEKDGPTGQDHTWFRKADARSGRWTSPDPYGGSLSINNPQSTNRYTYVENDPLNAVDPTGLFRNRLPIGPPLTIPGFRDASWGDYGDSWFGGSGGWDPSVWGFGGGDGTGQQTAVQTLQDQQNGRLTKEQCDTLRKLLERQEQHGFPQAARMSGNTFGDSLLKHFNSSFKPHIKTAVGPLDLDWFTDISGYSAGFQAVVYPIAKLGWTAARKISGALPANQPLPFQDPGERTAFQYSVLGWSYKDFFDEAFFKAYCSGN